MMSKNCQAGSTVFASSIRAGCSHIRSMQHSQRRTISQIAPSAAYRTGPGSTPQNDPLIDSARGVVDVALFLPRALAGAALQATSSTSGDTPVRRTPRDVTELADAAVVYAERGAQAEYEAFEAASALLPPELRSQIIDLLPWQIRQLAPQPRQQPTVIDVESMPAAEDPSITLAVANSPEVLLSNQLAAELAELKSAVARVHEAAQALVSRDDAAQEPMLRLNLREARDLLSRRLEYLSIQCSGGIGAQAAEEATFLLAELDGIV